MAIASLAILAATAALSAVAAPSPKYGFIFIGDGMSTPQRMVAEDFSEKSGRGALAMNALPYQANTRTRSADSIITDSAAAATAIACGVKADNGSLGLAPDGRRIESVAELAKRRGMKVGIATTVTIVHATPAGFYAHVPRRGAFYSIALALADSGFDFFCGGGFGGRAMDESDPNFRGDAYEIVRKAGYEVIIDDLAAWRALKPGGKSLGVFGEKGMSFAIDADKSQPTPAEIVEKGIELLDGPAGFFLMFEAGRVDYSAHANDAATNLHDIIAMDDAVKVALRFFDSHPDETLIVATGDHETGGMSMGFAGIGGKFKVELLARQNISVAEFSQIAKGMIKELSSKATLEDFKPLLTEKFGIVFDGPADDPMLATPAEIKALRAALAKDVDLMARHVADTTAHDVARRYVFAQAAKNVVNAHAGVGWSSGSHTALPTLTTAKGVGADILVGMRENSDLGARLKKILDRGN